MTQPQTLTLQVTPEFGAMVPAAPAASSEVTALSALAVTTDTRSQLVCKSLLVGDTLDRAIADANKALPAVLSNTQVLAVFGTDVLEGVNQLNDRMLEEHPEVDIPELNAAMKDLSHEMRGLGKKYNPNDPKVLAKYQQVKEGILAKLHLAKTFIDEFLDDISSLQSRLDKVAETLDGRQTLLLRNVGYYDEFYKLNETEIGKLIYVIAVMEILRGLVAEKANAVKVGDSNLGDRGGEQQAALLELVQLLDNRIIAFKSRLWVAWAMAPQIRTMRGLSIILSARIDQTEHITIPTMKNTIAIWLTLSEAQQSEQFNRSVEETANNVATMFAESAKATVPIMASALATPALDPRTIVAWSDSLSAQADGIIAALEEGKEKRAALEDAMIKGKQVVDAATQRVNQAQLQQVLDAAVKESPIQIATSVPAQS